MSDSMIERVARALCDEAGYDPERTDLGGGGGAGTNPKPVPLWQTHTRFARAALKALMEPNKRMLDAGYTAVDNCVDSTTDTYGSDTIIDRGRAALESWQAMLTQALEEK